ncbi:MAG: hypothetical protein PUF50_00080 [Erysipelotrichaceae bacterium]|nr:hypothetical protein [Erysipelotrichaceae bacterium]
MIKKKKKHTLRNIALASGTSMIFAYIGTQINEASKRYELKQLTYEQDNYRLEKIERKQEVAQPTQLYHEFNIIDTNTLCSIGTCKIYMGQEAHSYYEGHIEVRLLERSFAKALPAIYKMLIEVARKRLMSHIYLVCDKKDKDSKLLFELVGAKFNKTINIPVEYPTYSKHHKTAEQYKVELN